MSDYSERGAQPVEDAAVDDPPTVDEELAEREETDGPSGIDRDVVTNRDQTSDNPLAAEDDDD